MEGNSLVVTGNTEASLGNYTHLKNVFYIFLGREDSAFSRRREQKHLRFRRLHRPEQRSSISGHGREVRHPRRNLDLSVAHGVCKKWRTGKHELKKN